MNRRATRIVTCLSLSALLLAPAPAWGEQGERNATESLPTPEALVSTADTLDDAELVASPEADGALPGGDGATASDPNTTPQAGGWVDLEDGRHWIDPETGEMVTSTWVEDGGARYWIGADGRMASSCWHAEGDDWWWLGADGRMAADCWHRSGSDWYWMGPDGRMTRGWADLSSGSYYFSSSGIMETSRLVRTLGGIHWIGPDGTPLSGWTDTPDGRFYFDPSEVRHPAVLGLLAQNGVEYFIDAQTGMVRNAWAQLSDGSSAYAGADGVLSGRLVDGVLYVEEGVRASGFTSLSGSTFYADPATGKLARGWKVVGGSRYWFDADSGRMFSNAWHAEGGDWWWLGADGRMAADCWHRSGSDWYWMGSDGRMARGWMKINGSWHFFSPSGIMLTGWHAEDGDWWWFDASGVMQTGWVSVGGSWYWMGTDGRMATSCWHREGSDWYWLDANGKMATGWRLIGGTWYWFGGDGRWNEMSVLYPDMFNIAQNYTSQTNYLLLVDTSGCRTAVYYRAYGTWTPIREWICSPGAPATPTVKGQFTVTGKGYSFGSGYTCYYYTQFYGDYLFHSIKYNQGTFVVQDGRLGQQLSHGCVRLALENAKWIYDNIPYRTKVVIY